MSIPPATSSDSTVLLSSSADDFTVFNTVSSLRTWRNAAFAEGKSVGLVTTMGALHDGHLSLIKHSLAANDLTVVSIFVNPAQFAPHEDLSTYPRTLPQDLDLLKALSVSAVPKARKPMAIFVPSVEDMYPSSVSQDVQRQKGTFVEVKGYGHQMEGQSRPTFFRGVATVVTKLFNAIQPTHAYFGQKDIQQALLLRRMAGDLLLAHPTPRTVHIVPTMRDAADGLALSSRNAYLSARERAHAPALYAALCAGARAWAAHGTRGEAVGCAVRAVEEAVERARAEGVEMRLDYLEMNDPSTFDVVPDDVRGDAESVFILSGALWLGQARLIDNVLLGDEKKILY